MAGVVDVHRVHQHKVGCVGAAQVFGIVEQMRIGVGIVVIKMAVLNRQCRVGSVAIAGGIERRVVVQLAHPMVSGGSGGEAGGAGVVENALPVG